MNMIIPTTIVDNFFDDPIAVRNYALEQEYFTGPEEYWPGTRSKPLHEINFSLFTVVNKRLLSLFYTSFFNPDGSLNLWYNCSAYFQKVPGNLKSGRVHQDYNNLISGIIYLNTDSRSNSGTSICEPKPLLFPKHSEEFSENEQKFKNQQNPPQSVEINNSFFEESIIVKNKFNRLVAFDGHLYHKANEFSNEGEDRLTLVFFITYLFSTTPYPMIRMRVE